MSPRTSWARPACLAFLASLACGSVSGTADAGGDGAGAVDAGAGDFTLRAAPTSLSIPIGGQATVVLTVDRGAGVGDVTLSARDLPTSVTASFETNPVPAGTSTVVVTFAVAGASAPTSGSVTLAGTDGTRERTATVAITTATVTVAGTVRGARAGVTVGLVGKGTTTSNATGNFTFTDVTPPYDLYTVADGGLSVSPTRTVYYYDDLTSPTPIADAAATFTLTLLNNSNATVRGTRSGGSPTTSMLLVTDSGSIQDTPAASPYSMSVRWSPAAGTHMGTLYALQFTRRASGAPMLFEGYDDVGPTQWIAATNNTVNLTLAPVAQGSISGAIAVPMGFPRPDLTLTQELSTTFVPLWEATSTTNAVASVPVLPVGKSALHALSASGGATTALVHPLDPTSGGSYDVARTLPPPSVLSAPAAGATAVTAATSFAWSAVPDTIYELAVRTTTTTGTARAAYLVFTRATTGAIPSVPEAPIPPNQSFQWQVNGYGPHASMDAAVSGDGLEPVIATDFAGPPHTLTTSPSRAFTTQ